MIDDALIHQLQKQLTQDGIQKVVVGAVIKDLRPDGVGVLVLKRVDDDFMGGLVELPSGTVDQGEGLLDALKREVAEETGLSVKEVMSYVDSFDYISGSGKKTRQFNFAVSVHNGGVRLNPQEHQDFYWIDSSSEQFSQLNISDKTRKTILAALLD